MAKVGRGLHKILENSISGLPKSLDIYASSLTAFAMHSCWYFPFERKRFV